MKSIWDIVERRVLEREVCEEHNVKKGELNACVDLCQYSLMTTRF
jgi:hypothetical protein